jgi:hypothetical protein
MVDFEPLTIALAEDWLRLEIPLIKLLNKLKNQKDL